MRVALYLKRDNQTPIHTFAYIIYYGNSYIQKMDLDTDIHSYIRICLVEFIVNLLAQICWSCLKLFMPNPFINL